MSGAPDLEDALRRHLDEVARLLAALDAESAWHEDARRAAEAAVQRAHDELAAAALPSLDDDERLLAAAALLHLATFDPAAVRESVAARRAALRQRVDTAAGDPRFAGAEQRLTQLEQRARELVEPIAHLRESVRVLEQDQDFREYAAATDDERWWTFSFHRARASGARAFARHGAKRRVGDVRALVKRHREEQAALATLEQEVASLAGERQALRALLDEHRAAATALASLERDVLDELRAAYGAAQQYLDDDVLLPRFPDPPLRGLARRVSGCRARARYLEGLFRHHIERTRGALVSHHQDVTLALADPHAPRRGIGATVAEVEAQTRQRAREVEERRRLYRSTVERLLAFTRWDDCDPLAGELWWDAFTGGAIDGSFLDEVAWHRTMGRRKAPLPSGARGDARDGWARNALNAMEALAEAHAEVLAKKRSAPAPVELPDDDG